MSVTEHLHLKLNKKYWNAEPKMFNKIEFRTILRYLDWALMYNQSNTVSMLYIFIFPLTGAMKQHDPLKKHLSVLKSLENTLNHKGLMMNVTASYKHE